MKKEKKSHGVQLLIRCVVRDPDGKIITDTGRKPARSFVIQFLEFVYGMIDPSNVSATDLAGAETLFYKTGTPVFALLQIEAVVNDSDYGVVVGTGDTAATNTDYKLETQLTEGVGLGNITHGAQVVGTAAVVGANVDLVLTRAFTNNTGSTITVKEAGIYTEYSGVTGPFYHCIVRDVLPGSVDVPDKCSLTVIYTVRTTV